VAIPRGDFTELLRELRSAGPVDRVRLLAKSLAALRGLSPWDRKVLLRMAGFEGAEVLVERLAREDEATARRLRGLLKELEGRPAELERTMRALADPARRGEALDQLLAVLDEGFEEPEPEAAPPPPPEPPGAPVPEPPPVPERPISLAPPGPPPPRAKASRQGPRATARPEPGPQPPTKAAPPPKAPSSQASPPPAPPPKATPEPVLEPAPAPSPKAPPEPVVQAAPPPPRRPAAAAAPPSDPGGSAPEGDGSAAGGVLGRLLELRRRIAAGEAPDAAALRRAFDRDIPFPWARRRALQAWLEAAPPTDLDESLALIDELGTPSARAWCLGALAGRGNWSDAEWRRIVEAAPTPAARRRLERRR
jgi:hypothetical protein